MNGVTHFFVRPPGASFEEPVDGPFTLEQIQDRLDRGELGAAAELCLGGQTSWAPASAWRMLRTHPEVAGRLDRAEPSTNAATDSTSWSEPPTARASSASGLIQCAACLEQVPEGSEICPECDEPIGAPASWPLSSGPPGSGSLSMGPTSFFPEDPPEASWLRMHWRPLITIGLIGSLIATGIALRHLAPDRYRPPRRMSPAAATPVCDTPCWVGEACEMGRCVWAPPNDVGHLSAQPLIAGPFKVSDDMVDALPLDEERFAVSSLRGVEIYSARSGELLSLVSDAPHAQILQRVGDVLYASAPQRIYVIEVASTQVLKTIELGATAHAMAMSRESRRALVTLPGARTVAVIATDLHAVVDSFYFGDDAVGPVAIDGPGQRGLAATGRAVLPGITPPRGGALYAFDPSRLASRQDRVRAGMVGNPVDVLMIPDGQSSYVVLREADSIVPLRTLPSGTVLQSARIATCRQPEQLELVSRGRRAILRCNEGRSLEMFDLERRKLLRHLPLNARATDMAVTPDAQQTIVTLPHDGMGAIGVLDLETYELHLSEIGAEPHRVRLTPCGRVAVAVSDWSKVAWVIR